MTREEAIETIRRCCPKVGDSQCDFESALRELIPELAESEDERTRKWIVNLLHKLHYNPTAQPMALKAIEYLEKQKGQKSVEWSEEDTEMYINVASSLRGYACGLENEEHKRHIKKELDWLENRFKSLRPDTFQNGNSRWKTIEDEERLINTAISFLKDFADKGYENAVECIDWLKSLRRKFRED